MYRRGTASDALSTARAVVDAMIGELEGQLAGAAWSFAARAIVEANRRAAGDMGSAHTTIALQRYLGYSARFSTSVTRALRACTTREHILVICLAGSQPDRLARIIDGAHDGRTFIVEDANGFSPSAAVRGASGGMVLVSASTLRRAASEILSEADAHDTRLVIVAAPVDRVPTVLLERRTTVLTIPTIYERREELPLLVSAITADVRQQLHCGDVTLDAFMPTLFAYDWPHNLEELEQIVTALVGRSAFGSTREAAKVLGIARSTLSERLVKLGLGSKPRRAIHEEIESAIGAMDAPIISQDATSAASDRV